MLRPRWKNWYLTIFYALGIGSYVGLFSAFMGWYINEERIVLWSKGFCLVHILLWLGIYVLTELFEFIWKRVCK